MKQAFDAAQVPTPAWAAIKEPQQDIVTVLNELGTPVIVKPSVSGGSMGVGIKNVVSTYNDLKEQVQKMFNGYRGWQLAGDGIVAEAFIKGREFTTLIVGSWNDPANAIIYPPVERVFHNTLPPEERFLSFDRLWEIYEEETVMPGDENFYEYQLPENALHDVVKDISWKAYAACKGTGYTRVDLRMDESTGMVYVLEVNAQCGLSEDENFTSIGAILRLSNKSFTALIRHILEDVCRKRSIIAKDNKRPDIKHVA